MRASHARADPQIADAARSEQVHAGPQTVRAPGSAATHTCIDGQTTPAQGSMHAPPAHTRPRGQITPAQGSTQSPSRQIVPLGHGSVRDEHALSTQSPSGLHS
jgi:hypothetical protein